MRWVTRKISVRPPWKKVRQSRLEKKCTSSLLLPCHDGPLIQFYCIHPVLSLAFVPQTQAASSQLRQLRRNVPCSFSCPMSITWCIQNAGNATQCCDAMRAPLFGEKNQLVEMQMRFLGLHPPCHLILLLTHWKEANPHAYCTSWSPPRKWQCWGNWGSWGSRGRE